MTAKRDIVTGLVRALLLAAIALAFAVVQPGSSYASILQLDIAVDADALLATFDESSTSGAESKQAQAPDRPFSHSPDLAEDGLEYAHDFEAPGTTGTSSSSPTPGNSGGSAPCLMCQTFSLDEDPFFVHLAISQSLLLPTPPGVGLLRPPQ